MYYFINYIQYRNIKNIIIIILKFVIIFIIMLKKNKLLNNKNNQFFIKLKLKSIYNINFLIGEIKLKKVHI